MDMVLEDVSISAMPEGWVLRSRDRLPCKMTKRKE